MKRDRILSVICFVVALSFFILTFTIKHSAATASLGPKFWPGTLSVLIMILSVGIFVKSFMSNKSKVDIEKDIVEERIGVMEETIGVMEETKPDYPQNLWISFALLCLYVFLLPYVGFAISTLLFFTVNMFFMGLKNWKKLVPLAIVITVIMVIVFPNLLSIPLLRGVGIFKDISKLFY